MARREKKPVHKVVMTEGKRNIMGTNLFFPIKIRFLSYYLLLSVFFKFRKSFF